MAVITGRDIVQDALQELNVVEAGDTMDADLAKFGIGKLKRIFDLWNAKREAAYADLFTTYTLTANLNPHTIGPTGTFSVTPRPVSIDGAAFLITASNPATVRSPINIRDKAWYMGLSVPLLTSTIVTDLYYDPKWPNGELHFWPIPTATNSVELQTRVTLSQLELTDTFTLPPGYQEAVTLTLAEALCVPLGKQRPETLTERARDARATIFDVNTAPPRIQTRDAGMPGGGRNRGNYTNGWLT